MPDLKTCPACSSDDLGISPDAYGGYVECFNSSCELIGPSPDPDGSRWNALPRRDEQTQERAAIVRWLREHNYDVNGAELADAIERGEHRK